MSKEFPNSLAHFLLSIGFQSIGERLWLHEKTKVRVKAMPGESQDGDICIWEDQWVNKPLPIEKQLIARVTPLQSVFARDTRIVPIDATVARDFLDKEHVKGYLKGSCYFGCIVPPHRVFRGIESSYTWEGNPLLAVAVFGKSITMNEPGLVGCLSGELIEIATLANIRLVGGLTKFLQAYKDLYPDLHNVMSYVDKEWNTGKGFMAVGFEKVGDTEPIRFGTTRINKGNLKLRYVYKK
ncbi:MAG: hypothetical protein RI981_1728 [Bacteroidota bacterium]|jgi:hypothetical protein